MNVSAQRVKIVRAPSAEDIDAAVDEVISVAAGACAIGFVFSFRNDSHEQAFAKALRKRAPEIAVSVSSEVQPEFREYERLSTTVLNAYLQPVMWHYPGNLGGGDRRTCAQCQPWD